MNRKKKMKRRVIIAILIGMAACVCVVLWKVLPANVLVIVISAIVGGYYAPIISNFCIRKYSAWREKRRGKC